MASYSEMALVRGLSFLANAQTAVANNLANATTVGYKRRTPVAELTPSRFQGLLDGNLSSSIYTERVDWSPGTPNPTNDRFNVALEGDRFFKVKDQEGRLFFTRRGQLQVDKEGFLTSPGGFRYLDEQDREVRIGDTTSFKISPRGVITGKVEGELQLLGTLGVFRVVDQARLRPVGRSMYADTSGQLAIPDNPGSVRQGYLEQSNVEAMNELVRMIGIQRSFQSTAKALGTVGRIKQTFISAMQR